MRCAALSLVFVGVVGLIGRPKDWTWFGAVVFAFGLVHSALVTAGLVTASVLTGTGLT